jgi:hypothetical protein
MGKEGRFGDHVVLSSKAVPPHADTAELNSRNASEDQNAAAWQAKNARNPEVLGKTAEIRQCRVAGGQYKGRQTVNIAS